jgi:hypothetical protein
MKPRTRRLLAWLLVGLYWPALIVATHIPRLSTADLRLTSRDVTLHFFAFLILTLLYWLARYGKERPSFRRRGFYLTFLLLAVYAAADEFSQQYVHRTTDAGDLLSNLAGIGAGLALLFFLRKWWHWLAAYWIGLLVLTHWPASLPPIIRLDDYWRQFEVAYLMAAYVALTLLLWRSLGPEPRFLASRTVATATVGLVLAYAMLDTSLSAWQQGYFDARALLGALLGLATGVGAALLLARQERPTAAPEPTGCWRR